MGEICTTLNKIRAHEPCTGSWKKLLKSLGKPKTEADDMPLPMVHILDTLDLQDCFWAARSLPEHDRLWRLLACDFAEKVLLQVEHKFTGGKSPREIIGVARRFALGDASEEELANAKSAVGPPTWGTVWYYDACRATVHTASRDAWCAVWSTAWYATRRGTDSATHTFVWGRTRACLLAGKYIPESEDE